MNLNKRTTTEGHASDKTTMGSLNNVPDDILVYVLSFVDLKTAGRTSILCKRWRHVWTYINNLDFHDPEIFVETDKEKISAETVKYCNWVNCVTIAHRAPSLNFMRIQFPLDGKNHVNYIIKWVEFALRKKVANLELNLACAFGYSIIDQPILFHRPIFKYDSNTLKSPYLKYLHLENASTNGPFVEKVLSNCLHLEHLALKACIFSPRTLYESSESNMFCVKIAVSSPKLRHLEFFRCQCVTTLQIYAPKLSSLVFIVDHKAKMEYTSVPSLVDVTFHTWHCYYLFQNLRLVRDDFSFHRLEKLALLWHRVSYAYYGLPELCVDKIPVLVTLIEACPLLHTFKLELCHHTTLTMPRPANLKDVEINKAKKCRNISTLML